MTLHFTSLYYTLNKHAPIKKKYIRAKHAKIVSKDLQKAIMVRSRLRNNLLKEKSMESKMTYSATLALKWLKKANKEHYQNISLSEITDNKKFWKTVILHFGKKVKKQSEN